MLGKALLTASGLAAVLFLVALFLTFKDSVPGAVRSLLGKGEAAQSQPASVAPAAKPKVKAKVRKAHGEAARETASASAPSDPPIPAQEIEVRRPPFPREADLRAGMARSEVVSKYGLPTFTATWYETRKLHEKYIYKEGDNATAISIEDGRVVTTRSLILP